LPNGTSRRGLRPAIEPADGGYPVHPTVVVYSGSLPVGLELDSGGTIQGTPTGPVDRPTTLRYKSATIMATDAGMSLTINKRRVLQVMTTSLSGGTINVPYNSQQLTASGAQPPYSWSLGVGGVLPPGLSLSTSGVISGTPDGRRDFQFRCAGNGRVLRGRRQQACRWSSIRFQLHVTLWLLAPGREQLHNGVITLQWAWVGQWRA